MLRLRPYKNCDAQYITKWIKDEFSFRQWCADRYDSYPISAEDMNNHYAQFAESGDFYPMTAFNESGVVGHMIMRFIDDKKTTIRYGFVIVDDSKRGMGYGKEMLSLAIKYSFEILKVQKITLGVFENNESAYYCYKSVGFVDVEEDDEYYNVLNEKWKCKEMEMKI